MEKPRISTGIPALDSMLGGGLLACRSYLVTGGPGTGKSIFCMQYILNGLMLGEKAVYVTVDEKPSEIIEEAGSLGWDFRKFVDDRRLLILDASPFFAGRSGSAYRGAGLDVAKTVSDLANYVKRMEASRIAIDPVGPLIDSSDSLSATQAYARTLVHALRDQMETTNLLTLYDSGVRPAATAVEEHMVAGVVILGIKQIQERLARTLMVRKMRGTHIDLTEQHFSIVKEKGIVLEEKTSPVCSQ